MRTDFSYSNTLAMTAKQLSFSKMKLMEVSKELYLQHGWDMPKGMIEREARNPLNFSRAEWQQAQRAKQDPRMVKALFKDAWQRSDSPDALKAALEQKGYYLARGDRRGVVAVDYRGEAYALSRWSGVKAKDVSERFGKADALPSVDEQREMIAGLAADNLRAQAREIDDRYKRLRPSVEFKRTQMVERQRIERTGLAQLQKQREEREIAARTARLPNKGAAKLWSQITGKYSKLKAENEHDAWQALRRDQAERDKVVARQIDERQRLQAVIKKMQKERNEEIAVIRQEIANYLLMRQGKAATIETKRPARTENLRAGVKKPPRERGGDERERQRQRKQGRDRGPGF